VTPRDAPGVEDARSVEDAGCVEDAGGVEIEIGCGNGHFLSEYGSRMPGTRLIGLDIKKKRCLKAREKADKRGLANVTIVHESAEHYLRGIPAGSVGAFHIYFPDPWPRSRHRKRRFFTMESLRLMHALLASGGRLFFGTDFFDYYIQAKVLVALHPGFELTVEPAPPEVLQSLYARKSMVREKAIRLFTAVKKPSADEEREHQEYEGSVDGEVEPDEDC
jgi:tRNA (guanine-N7-)-methyltransferase